MTDQEIPQNEEMPTQSESAKWEPPKTYEEQVEAFNYFKENYSIGEADEYSPEALDEAEKLFVRLPKKFQEDINSKIEVYRESGSPQVTLDRVRCDMIVEANQIYIEKRFGEGFESKMGAKKRIRDRVVESMGLDSRDGIELLAHSARISIDINGLKSINDITKSHEAGDKFLQRMADKLRLVQEKLVSDPSFNLASAYVSTEGGDEFGLFIECNSRIDIDTKNKIFDYINKELVVDCSDLLPEGELVRKGVTIREDFPGFYSSAGIGIVRLDEAVYGEATRGLIEKDVERKKKKLIENNQLPDGFPDKEVLRDSFMSHILDVSDALMLNHKKDVKANLDLTTREILLRNDETRELFLEKESIEIEKIKLQSELSDCEAREKIRGQL